MARTKVKPFSRTELKILIYNKIKKKGMSYADAYKQVSEEIALCNKAHNEKEQSEKRCSNEAFKGEFERMKDG